MHFALALSAVFVIGSISAGFISYTLQTQELSQRLEADVRAMAESLAHTARTNDRQDLLEQVEVRTRTARDAATLVAFIDGRTGESSGNFRVLSPFEGLRRLVTDSDLTLLSPPPAEVPEAYFAYGIRTDLGYVIAGRDEAWVAESGEILLQTTATGLGAALLLSVAMALFIARRNERRIVAMEGVLHGVGTGQFGLRIRDGANDDFARLAGQIDIMLERLEAGIDAIRQVSTDVAHELRAPLSRLRMRLEPHVLATDLPPETRRDFGAALVEIDGISETFDAILRLARLQSGSVQRREEPVDLCRLAREIHELLVAAAEDTGHCLTLDLPEAPVVVTGDNDLLCQALTNLVDNALRHCPPPARVAITVGTIDGAPALSVCDNGPGIPTTDRQRVTERFVRLERSRTTPGTGLGLSLVRAIADLHGATLTLESNDPGLCARLTFF